MNRESLKRYRREFVMSVLGQTVGAMNAAEIAEVIQSQAMMAGHPKECWGSTDAATVAGVLKALADEGIVVRIGMVGTRSTYKLNGNDFEYPKVPTPPTDDEDVAEFDYDQLDKRQVRALLEVGDEVSALMAKFQAEMQQMREHIRARLAEVGLEA